MDVMRLTSIFPVLITVLCLGTAAPVTGQSTAPEDDRLSGLLETLGFSVQLIQTRCFVVSVHKRIPLILRCSRDASLVKDLALALLTAALPLLAQSTYLGSRDRRRRSFRFLLPAMTRAG